MFFLLVTHSGESILPLEKRNTNTQFRSFGINAQVDQPIFNKLFKSLANQTDFWFKILEH